MRFKKNVSEEKIFLANFKLPRLIPNLSFAFLRIRSSSQKRKTSCLCTKHEAIVKIYFSKILQSLSFYVILKNMNYFGALPQFPPFLLFTVFLWSLLWKGVALWKAAKLDQRNWFIVLLIVNALGILEIVYLFWFAKKRMKLKDLRFWESLST